MSARTGDTRLPGFFLTLEGGEGAGKSTLARGLAAHLEAAGREALLTREPGGTPLAEALRAVILAGEARQAGPFAEALLFSAARIDHVDRVIRPALRAGQVVICDRFADSTRAYQGALGRMDRKLLNGLEQVTLDGVKPQLTLILDLPAELGLARAAARRGDGAEDRFEGERIGFHRRLRQAFSILPPPSPSVAWCWMQALRPMRCWGLRLPLWLHMGCWRAQGCYPFRTRNCRAQPQGRHLRERA